MTDLFIDSNGGFKFEMATYNEALRSRLGVFLSIRASNGYDDGELDYDINQGLDFEFLYDSGVSDELKKEYIYNQIMRYYDEVKEVGNIAIEIDKKERSMKINFEFKSIFSDEYVNAEVINLV